MGDKTESTDDFFSRVLGWFTIVFIPILTILFILSLKENSFMITQNHLFFLAFIVVLIASYRFSDLQIPGFLKLSRKVDDVLKETPSIENGEIPETRNVQLMNDEQRVKQLSSDGEYFASISLLRNVIYNEMRNGLELRQIPTPNSFEEVLEKIKTEEIYDLDLIDGIKFIDKLYHTLENEPKTGLIINQNKFESALDYGLARYFRLKDLNEHPEERDF